MQAIATCNVAQNPGEVMPNGDEMLFSGSNAEMAALTEAVSLLKINNLVQP